MGGELDRLVAPLGRAVDAGDQGRAVDAGDQGRAVDAAEVAIDEGAARLGLVGGALGQAEVPFLVLDPGVATVSVRSPWRATPG